MNSGRASSGFFFFQVEDGIRAYEVTGVQTCALPISIFKKLREQSGHELVPRDRGIMRLYKILRRKGRTALLVDLTVPPTQGAVAIDCFGLKTSVTSAHAWLHERTSVPIVPAHTEPLPDGRYRLVFHPKI